MLVRGLDLLLRWLEQNIFPKWWWIQWWWISNGRKLKKNWSKHKGGGDTGLFLVGWLVVWLWLVGGNTFLCGGRRLFGSIDKCTISKHKISMYIYSIHTRNWTYIPKIAIVFRNYFDPTSNMILLPMTRRVIMMVRFTWVIYILYGLFDCPDFITFWFWSMKANCMHLGNLGGLSTHYILHNPQGSLEWMQWMGPGLHSWDLGSTRTELAVVFFGGEVGKARWHHLKRPPCFKREEVLFVYGNNNWLWNCFWDPIKFWEWGVYPSIMHFSSLIQLNFLGSLQILQPGYV